MIECLILGDSIAVGTGLYRPECKVLVQQGITSKGWNMSNVKSTLDANTVVISLGSNDYAQIDSLEELTKLRKRIHAEKVYWIMPAIKPDVQEIIENIAHQNSDWIIQIPYLSNDGVHPTMQGYRKIAEITK
jgi:lysophospholipase L1-like esterase